VLKADLGTKRICIGCSAKFYDLRKTPIICPICEAVFEPPTRSRRDVEPKPMHAVAVKDEPAVDDEDEAEAEVDIPLLDDADDDEAAGIVRNPDMP
jgi:uncharacterized protein (TIGR02300 family)